MVSEHRRKLAIELLNDAQIKIDVANTVQKSANPDIDRIIRLKSKANKQKARAWKILGESK